MNATLSSAAAVARREGARRRARLDGHPLAPYALVLPATLYLLVFQGYPLSVSYTHLTLPTKA